MAEQWDEEFAKVLGASTTHADSGLSAPGGEALQTRAPRDIPEYAKGQGELGAALRENAESKIAKIRSSHDTIADMMICHPEMTKQAIAAKLGYTPTYLSIVTGSDAFKVRLANRRAQFVDPIVQASVEEMFGAMTERACEVLLEKLNQPTNVVDPQLALQAAQLGAKVAGMGGFGAKTAVINVAPSEDRLNRLADNLTRLAGGLGAEASGARKAASNPAVDATVINQVG